MSKHYRIGILAFDGVLTSELTGPAEVFGRAARGQGFEAEVLLIGVDGPGLICSEEGLHIAVDTTLAEAPALDALLVPGGNDMSALLDHAALNDFIRQQAASAEWVGSVCAGAWLLGKAGLLDGTRATTWRGGEASLQADYPAIQVVDDQPVVIDRRRITANGGLVSYRAALVLLGQLAGLDQAREVYEGLSMGRIGRWEEIAAEIGQ